MKKIIMTLAAVLCCVMTTTVFTACDNRDKTATTEMSEDSTALVINLDSIEIKPYMAFGSSLADVEKYLKATYADLYLSADGSIEVQVSSWEKDGAAGPSVSSLSTRTT